MKNDNNNKNNMCILLVDEELSWLKFAEKILLEAGNSVIKSQSLEDALKFAQKEQFKLILVDLRKIEQEKEVFHELVELQLKKGYSTVVLFPTELTPEKAGEIFKIGALDCIDKPYDKSKLLALVEKHYEKRPVPILTREKQSKKKLPIILIVEDDKDWCARLADYLKNESYKLNVVSEYSAAAELLQKKHFDLIILDLRLIDEKEDFEGMKLLQELRKKDQEMQVIIVSAYGTIDHIRTGFRIHNISDYISKQSFDRNKYLEAVKKAILSKCGER